jgi:hypothetical protein
LGDEIPRHVTIPCTNAATGCDIPHNRSSSSPDFGSEILFVKTFHPKKEMPPSHETPYPESSQQSSPSKRANPLATYRDDNSDEKKEKEPVNRIYRNNEITLTTLNATQCDMVLESMDECVGCLDGIGEQQTFEEQLKDHAACQRQIAMEHGLSEAEATLIRLQMIGDVGIRSAVKKTLTSINPLTLCGQPDNSFSDLCDGLVSPMDTTLPTTVSGNSLVESRRGKSGRSLVDEAVEVEGAHEMKKIDTNVQECAICNDASDRSDLSFRPSSRSPSFSARNPTFCRLPCCETEALNGNFKVCTACMLVLTVSTKDGISRVGRCPRCRTWLSLSTLHSTLAQFDIRILRLSGKCETCLQIKGSLIVDNPAICDACFLGREVPLIYECEECQQSQKIQSIMYRSQPTATSFGNEMWPCNTCHKSTHWKIRFEQLSSIPAGDIPEEWGEYSLVLARLKVQKARKGLAKLDLLGRDAHGNRSEDDGCAVM